MTIAGIVGMVMVVGGIVTLAVHLVLQAEDVVMALRRIATVLENEAKAKGRGE